MSSGPQTLEDLEAILRAKGLRYDHEGGALVHNLTAKKGEAELVFEIHEEYETQTGTRDLWIYAPGLIDARATRADDLNACIRDVAPQTGGRIDKVLEGARIGVTWSFPLIEFSSLDAAGSVIERVVAAAGLLNTTLRGLGSPRPHAPAGVEPDDRSDNEALQMIAAQLIGADFRDLAAIPSEALLSARRAIRRLLTETDSVHDSGKWASFNSILGDLCGALYSQSGNEEDATEAEKAYRSSIELLSGKRWAVAQVSLGTLLRVRYERTMIERYADVAEAAFQAAMSVRTEEADPEGWANCLHYLGQLFKAHYDRSLAEKDGRAAEDAYLRALRVFSRSGNRRRWSSVKHSLANLYTAWYKENGDDTLASLAEQSYQQALSYRTGEDWARTMLGLGNLSSERFERTGIEKYVWEARGAYEKVLSTWDPMEKRIDYVTTLMNLGCVCALQYEHFKTDAPARRAEEAFLRAMELITPEVAPALWAATSMALAMFYCSCHAVSAIDEQARKAVRILSELVYGGFSDFLPSYDRLRAAMRLADLHRRLCEPDLAERSFSTAITFARIMYLGALDQEDRASVTGRSSILYSKYAMFLVEQGAKLSALVVADANRARALAGGMSWAQETLQRYPAELRSKYRAALAKVRDLEADWQRLNLQWHQERWMSLRKELGDARRELENLAIELEIGPSQLTEADLDSISLPQDTAVVELIGTETEATALVWRGRKQVEAIHLQGASVSELSRVLFPNSSHPVHGWMAAYDRRERDLSGWVEAQQQIAQQIEHTEPFWGLGLLRERCTFLPARKAVENAFAGMVRSIIEILERIIWRPITAVLGRGVRRIVLVPTGLLLSLPLTAAAPPGKDPRGR